MQGLAGTDARRLLELANRLCEVSTGDELGAMLLPDLRRLVSCDIAAYNRIDLVDPARTQAVSDPAAALETDGVAEAFRQFASQSPLIAHYASRHEERVLRLSDFIDFKQLQRLELYDLVYGPVGISRQIAFVLPAATHEVVGFSLSRGGPEFTERERRVLQNARPLIASAYARLRSLAIVERALAEVQRSARTTWVILADRRDRIEFATPEAERWLRETFGNGASSWLPEEIRAAAGTRRSIGAQTRLPSIQVTRDAADGLDAFLLKPPAGARGHGLTERESEILDLVAEGLTNSEIAHKLGISTRTVIKHLEHVFEKLGVHSRTAAIAAFHGAPPRTSRH